MKMKMVKVIFTDGQTMYAEPEHIEWFWETFGTAYFGGKIKAITEPFIMGVI